MCSDIPAKPSRCEDLPEPTKERREEMRRETWIRNVLRIYPEKTREQAEQLFTKLFTS